MTERVISGFRGDAVFMYAPKTNFAQAQSFIDALENFHIRLICLIDPENAASQRVAQRVGMGIERRVDGITGGNFPTLIYSIRKNIPRGESIETRF